MKHTYVHGGTFSKGKHWEKYDMRVANLVGLLIANLIPVVNLGYFIAFWPIMYDNSDDDYDNVIKLMPPEELQDELKPSLLDKLLNKKL